MFRDGGTFSHQANLPRLPIPTLKHTAEVYLKSLKPILNEDEYNATEENVNDFFLKPNGLGEVLQQRLIEYDKTQKYSWIEKWWFEKVYWEWREPLMVNSNWYILFVDDSNQPSELVTQNGGRLPRGGFGKFQISRAAHLINRSLDYKALLDGERLPVDKTKSGYLDMDQYTKIFGVTRIPLEGCDTMVNAHPHTSKHIIVLVRDQIYTVDVYDTSGKRVPDGNIEKQLQAVVEDVQRSNNQVYPPICLLTADNRDEWAKVHKRLCRLDPTNRDTFNVIEDALFAVSLDDYSSGRLPDQQVRNVLLTPDGHNRWFDKSVSIIVESNGKAGMNGEHSPCDALIPSIYAEYILKDATDVNAVHSRYDATARVATPRRLKFVIDSNIEESLRQAQARVQKTIDDSDACVLHFEDYGIGFIKKSAQVSPDAYMQMALQLGYFKLHKKCVPTYETASTRRFLHGRTETTRTLSCESKKWVEAMERSDVDSTFKYTLLREAVDAHINFATMAGNGQGCDRHMLGLRLVMKPGESHNVFTNSAFSRSQKWQLSTSGLSAGDYFNGTGFGTVYPDGYGINYLTGENILKFGIESKRSCAETSSTNFRNAVVQALRDMQKITLEAGPGGKAKL